MPAATGAAVCRAQAVAVAVEGRTGTGVSGVHTGVAAPTISAIPTADRIVLYGMIREPSGII